jgi:hypothetical protein
VNAASASSCFFCPASTRPRSADAATSTVGRCSGAPRTSRESVRSANASAIAGRSSLASHVSAIIKLTDVAQKQRLFGASFVSM